MPVNVFAMLIFPDTPIDLHLHTTYSDGRWTAEDLFNSLARCKEWEPTDRTMQHLEKIVRQMATANA